MDNIISEANDRGCIAENERFLATYVIGRPSVCRLSVCLSVVC